MLIAAIGLGLWGPRLQILGAPWSYSGILLFGLGAVITISASRRFRRMETNINTFRNPDILVTSGLFAFSRNPMYLGFVLTLFGVGVVFDHWPAMLPAGVFFLACHYWYIPFEEKAALEQFGDRYKDYKRRVRRWI